MFFWRNTGIAQEHQFPIEHLVLLFWILTMAQESGNQLKPNGLQWDLLTNIWKRGLFLLTSLHLSRSVQIECQLNHWCHLCPWNSGRERLFFFCPQAFLLSDLESSLLSKGKPHHNQPQLMLLLKCYSKWPYQKEHIDKPFSASCFSLLLPNTILVSSRRFQKPFFLHESQV